MSKFKFAWKRGWSASKLERLHPHVFDKRIDKIFRAAVKAIELYDVPEFDSEYVGLRITCDLTSDGDASSMSIADLVYLARPIVQALRPNLPHGVSYVYFSPVQAAKMNWKTEQRKGYTKTIRRLSRSTGPKWRQLARRMRLVVFGAAVTVEIVHG